MRASIERRRAEEQRKQARRKELGGLIGAALTGLALGLPFFIYSLIY